MKRDNTTPKRRLYIGVALICVFVIAGIAGGFGLGIFGAQKLPDLVGTRQDYAKDKLESLGYAVQITEVYTPSESGFVTKMNPPAGSFAKAGQTIELSVSKQSVMPNLEGLSKDEATKLLDEQNIPYEFDSAASDEPADTVIKQSIAAQTAVGKDTKATVTLARVPKLPDLVGKTEKEAIELLKQEGLTPAITYIAHAEGVNAGCVAASKAQDSNNLGVGSIVNLEVVYGPDTTIAHTIHDVLTCVYSTNPLNPKYVIGTNLRQYLASDAEVAEGLQVKDATDKDIWFGVVKGWKKVEQGADKRLQVLPRHLESTDAIVVTQPNVFTCKITVLWDWSCMGGEYVDTTSKDTREVVLTFNTQGKLVSFSDPQGDVPEYEVVSQ